jgi:SAM-dependent methyltransferase
MAAAMPSPCMPFMDHHPFSDQPSAWVVRFTPLILRGEVLDLACGGGRHARHLAAQGHRVVALDRDGGLLERLAAPDIVTMQYDLEQEGRPWPFEAGRFSAIVVTNYLHRPLFPHLIDSLAPDGVLIYETFAHGNQHFGKPSNPDFLLAPGELLDVVRSAAVPLRVLAFEDGYVAQPKPAMMQRICAMKPGQGAVQPERLRLF